MKNVFATNFISGVWPLRGRYRCRCEYKGVVLDCGYRLDLVVEDSVVLELKCVEHIMAVHEAQLLTCLKMTGKRVGLILNFNVADLDEEELFGKFFDLRASVVSMSKPVKLVECPRDAWQGLKGQIPAYIKTDYLKALISAGFKHIDAVSFVSPKAVPQMADSEEVLKELDPPDDVEIIGIVVNEKGAQRAIATEAVRTLGFPVFRFADFLAE